MIYYLKLKNKTLRTIFKNKTLQKDIKIKTFWRLDTKSLIAEIDIGKVFLDLVLKTFLFMCFKQIVSTVKIQYLKVLLFLLREQ